MESTHGVSHSGGHKPVVTSEVLEAAIAEQKKHTKGYDPLGTEPVLKQHLYDEMLKVCGRMGLAGAPPGVVHGVRGDVERLLDLTVATLQAANRELWEGFLPQVDDDGLKVRPPSSPGLN